MTVYIVQEAPGKNLVPAQKYGELELLLPARTNLMLSTGPEVEMTYYPVSFDIRRNTTELGEVYV